MAENKTQPTNADVTSFLQSVEHPTRRADAVRLNALFQEVTGWQPRLWGASIIGFGQYHYRYASGREGDFLATGFSLRKANMSLYIMPGYSDFGAILSRLGKHKTGKACLYINRFADIDEAALRDLIRAGLENLSARYTVTPG